MDRPKEHPILFSTEMVRAILEGRKTQTRRVITKPEKYEHIRDCDFCCPYGQISHRLWVRETWMPSFDKDWKGDFIYKADKPDLQIKGWHPSIFMPRKVSRITLEITEIRVQKLQEISEQDAKDEGICFRDDNAVECYRQLWDSINGKKYPWKDNPWVWAITFKALGPTVKRE